MIGKEKTENYLKTIYRIQKSSGQARGIDIAAELNVSRPTVCVAIKELRKKGYVKTYDDGSFLLTRKGIEEAQSVEERFIFLTDMLTFLNVDKAVAAEDACRLEHSLSDDSYKALQQFFGTKIAQKDNGVTT